MPCDVGLQSLTMEKWPRDLLPKPVRGAPVDFSELEQLENYEPDDWICTNIYKGIVMHLTFVNRTLSPKPLDCRNKKTFFA